LVVVSGFLADAEAFSRFYRGYARSVLLFFARRTIDSEAAPDLTAETFAAAFASRNSFRGATNGEAGAWLLVIARRQLSRYFEAGRCRASSCAGSGWRCHTRPTSSWSGSRRWPGLAR
jgi:DNA-directed RNA polymerase specialized sigma24 family protein